MLDSVIWLSLYILSIGFLTGEGGVGIGLLVALGMGVLLIYTWIKSTSPGKWLLGMYAYRASGKPLGFGLMLVRETVGKLLSGLVFSLGYLWILLDRDRQGWHDKLVGSYVMVRQGARLADPPGRSRPAS